METSKLNKWVIDAAHSDIRFKVKHLMISNVSGKFTRFEGLVTTSGNDFSTAVVNVAVDAASISTEVADRDAHLRSADFFDTDNHPALLFEAKGLRPLEDDIFELTGDLTMRGVTKPLSLKAEFGGVAKDPWGNVKAGFTITGKLNRKDWGLTWNAALEAGGFMVGEEIRISSDVELVLQPAE